MKTTDLIIGLCYNLRSAYPLRTGDPEDAPADCEDEATVEAVEAALAKSCRQVVRFPYGPNLLDDLRRQPPDIVFNIAEGWRGRNRESHLPCLLEMLGIPHTGSDALTLGITMDKALCKRLAAAAGVPTAPFLEVKSLQQLRDIPFQLPAFVKPNWEGSSKGIRYSSIAEDEESLKERVAWCLESYKQPVLVEKFLGGREFTVGLLGNESPRVFPIGEIVFFHETKHSAIVAGEFNRFKPGRELQSPASIPPALSNQLQEMALAVCRAIGCRDVARADMRCDEDGDPYFLEINALPGLSPQDSMLPMVAKAGGMEYAELVEGILTSALQRLGI
jgi:D-alanine-D-alanine ligase